MKSYKDIEKLACERARSKLICKHCGCRSNIMPNRQDRVLCNWCNNYVYRTPELEFKYKLKQEMRKREKEDEQKKNV